MTSAVYVAMVQWPGCMDAIKPPNAGLRLFGGAAFERCLNEFQVATNSLVFPTGMLHLKDRASWSQNCTMLCAVSAALYLNFGLKHMHP
jgi:hypothetical protein